MKKNVPIYLFCFYALFIGAEVNAQIIPAKQVNFADAARRSMISSNTSEIEKEADGGWKEERTDMPIPRGANIKRHIINVANRNEENRQESPLSAATFNGLDDNAVNIPPDVAGTVGTAHIMTTLNDRYRVADKTGLALSTSTSIAFWAPLPGTATGHSDPHVKYDHYANRWILVAQTSPLLDNYLLLAVSQTNDPGGVWNKYAVKIDIGGAIDSAMDYPLIAFNQDRIVVSFNVFNTAGTINQGSRIYLFDKANVYAGGAISFTPVTGNAQRLDNDNTQGFSMCPTIIYEPIASPTTTMYTLQNWSSAGGLIRLVSLTGTIPTVTWNTGAATFPASAVTWNASSPTGDFAPQKGDLRKITNNDPRISSAVLVNGKIWCTHSVFIPTGTATRTAVQWWQLQTNGTVLQNAKIDDPSGKIFRAFSSIAVNDNEDVLIGYSIFSDSIFAGAAYSFRSSCLPVNTLMDEVVYKGGVDRYFKNFGGTRDRWGDFSTSCVDPSNQSLWTIQEYGAARTGTTLADNDSKWGTWWANVVAPANNAISFSTGSQIVAETSSGGACPKFTDYSIIINARCAATGNATINLTPTGSATNGVDYQLIPSSVSFVNGEQTKTVTLRVFDDTQVEGTETINLGYTIASGTGVTSNDDNQTQVITITDADAAATTGFNYTSLIGVNSGSNNTTSPFQATNLRGKFQFIYLASELRAKGFKAGNLNGLSMFINTLGSGGAFVYNGFTISLGHTANNSYPTNITFLIPILPFTPAYSNNYTVTATGTQTFNFTTPFAWDGSNNVLVEICFDNTGGSVAGANDLTNATTTPLGSGLTCLLASRNTIAGVTTTGCNLTAVTGFSTFRPDITFSQPVAPSVPASVLVSTTVILGPNADAYVYNATGEIQARIKNNTAHDYGCTQVIIDRAGTTTTAFWNNTTANRLLDKTFRVIPTNPNPTGSYDVTLYYTNTEVTNWQTATGNTWLGNAKIVKIKEPNQISTVTPSSPPSILADIEVNLPSTPATFGTNYSITATFATGFSGFGVGNPGSPVLPITLLSFNGTKNNNVVELTWETAFESNNSHFEIETGKQQSINLNKIGSVNSKGNSTSVQTYGYTDNLPVTGVNYYRLKQVDFDGNFSYSKTIAVAFDKKGRSLTVYPNPAKEKLTIAFAEPQESVTIRIISTDGKEIKRETAGSVQRTYNVAIEKLIPGSYIIEISMGKEKHTVQFVKD